MPAVLTGTQLEAARAAVRRAAAPPERSDAQDIADALREFAKRLPPQADLSALEHAVEQQGAEQTALLQKIAVALAGNRLAIAALAEAMKKEEAPPKVLEKWRMTIVERDHDGRAKVINYEQVR